MTIEPKKLPENLQLVIFDWAGTIIDFGCQAPVHVLKLLFENRGIILSDAAAREPMGLAKRDHIAALLKMPTIHQEWKTHFGNDPGEADIDDIYAEFLPLQKEILSQHAEPIPGAIELFDTLRKRGIQIGSTTGYTRELMDVLLPEAEKRGLKPDFVVTSDEVPSGRPAPDLIRKVMELAHVDRADRVLKVDDTLVGIQAARNAGSLSVALTASGNSLGLTEAEFTALTPEECSERLTPIEEQFQAAGADYVLPTVAEIPSLLP